MKKGRRKWDVREEYYVGPVLLFIVSSLCAESARLSFLLHLSEVASDGRSRRIDRVGEQESRSTTGSSRMGRIADREGLIRDRRQVIYCFAPCSLTSVCCTLMAYNPSFPSQRFRKSHESAVGSTR